jgi:hypothetical protein
VDVMLDTMMMGPISNVKNVTLSVQHVLMEVVVLHALHQDTLTSQINNAIALVDFI